MLNRTLVLCVLLFAVSGIAYAQRSHRFPAKQEALITALAYSKNLPGVFGDDGIWVNTLLEDDPVPPEVRRIVNLGPKAIPLLIEHLDDMRLTRMQFCCTSEAPGTYPVTVADAALDILTGIVREKGPMFDEKCVKDRADGNEAGEATCISEGYYLDMPSFRKHGKTRVAASQTRDVKRNWQRAYRRKQVRYQKYE